MHTGDAGLPPILVVDDNHDNAEIIRQYLEIRGYPITVAHNGDEALALFETVRPALVLLDVMMPGRDGWEVCRIMKQHPTLGKNVRIIMVTALDEWDDKREALQTRRGRLRGEALRSADARQDCAAKPRPDASRVVDGVHHVLAARGA